MQNIFYIFRIFYDEFTSSPVFFFCITVVETCNWRVIRKSGEICHYHRLPRILSEAIVLS